MIKKLLYILPLIILCSCSKWLDVNEDPNTPKNVKLEELLPAGITSTAYIMGGRYQVLGALWSQHWTQSPGASQYAGIDAYDINSSSFDDRQYGALYSGALKNFEEIRQRAYAEQEWKYYMISTIMQCYIFQVLADLYEEIPFSEALIGENENFSPKFEHAKDIYDSLIVRIDNVIDIDVDDKNLQDPENADLLFFGDMDKWIAFSNTLKLKIYLRQSEVYPTKAKTAIEKLYTDEVKFLNNNVAVTQYTNSTGNRNPLYDTEFITLGGNPNLILSRTLHNYLIEMGDARLSYLFVQPQIGSSYKSNVQGDFTPDEEVSGINSASYSKPFLYHSFPVYLMSFEESKFLQCEAITRYKLTDDWYKNAKEAYDDAVTMSYMRVILPFGVAESAIQDEVDRKINGGEYQFPPNNDTEEQYINTIAMQKWLSLAGIQSLETFFEQNRNKYPIISRIPADDDEYKGGKLTPSIDNVSSNRFPKRLIIPESELSKNVNAPAKKAVWEKIWWDVKEDIYEE